jgi:hypothetical protein
MTEPTPCWVMVARKGLTHGRQTYRRGQPFAVKSLGAAVLLTKMRSAGPADPSTALDIALARFLYARIPRAKPLPDDAA